MSDKESTLEEFLDELGDTKDGCVGFMRCKNKVIYAISGCTEKSKSETASIQKALSKLFTMKLERATVRNSFSMLSTNLFFDYNLTPKIYNANNVLNKHFSVEKAAKFSISFIKYNSYLLMIGYDSRKFSCVEKKILGYSHFSKDTLYVSRRPCYECLLCIQNVVFSSNSHKQIYSLERVYSAPFKNDFIYLKIK